MYSSDVDAVTGATRSVNGSDLTLSSLGLKPDNITLIARFARTYHPESLLGTYHWHLSTRQNVSTAAHVMAFLSSRTATGI
jgi:hypothetical protein